MIKYRHDFWKERGSIMSKKLKTEAVDHLFDAILCLQNREECYTFFRGCVYGQWIAFFITAIWSGGNAAGSEDIPWYCGKDGGVYSDDQPCQSFFELWKWRIWDGIQPSVTETSGTGIEKRHGCVSASVPENYNHPFGLNGVFFGGFLLEFSFLICLLFWLLILSITLSIIIFLMYTS